MKRKRIFAAAAAFMMLAGMSSCGMDNGESMSDPAPSDAASSADEVSEAESETEPDEKTDKKEKEKTQNTTEAKKDTQKDTATAAAAEKTEAKSGENSKSDSKTSGSSGNTSSGGNTQDNKDDNSNKNDNNNNSTDNTAPTAAQQQESSGGGQAEQAQAAEEKTYEAEVVMSGSPTVSGSNVTVSGGVVRITAGGSYHITGSASDAQICVDTATEDKVKIVLDGVDISCQSGPALLINEAKRCTVELADGSYNRLSDGGDDRINNGVIFSNDTLRIKGSGTLEINSGNAHGIASDDDVIIESGTYVINSVKSGIFAHDDITITGGDLDIKGGTNGIKSKGTINIKGGRTIVSGGLKEEKSSVYAASVFNYEGGELYAAGSKVSEPSFCKTPYVVVDLSASPGSAGSTVEFVLNGVVCATMQPHNDFRCLMMLSPDTAEGAAFNSYINGGENGENIISGMRNVFKAN